MMALRNENKNVAAAKIVGMSGKWVTVVTAEGNRMRIPLTKNNQHDKLMIASLKDIWHAGIWIPVNTKLKHFFRFDWLTAPVKDEQN